MYADFSIRDCVAYSVFFSLQDSVNKRKSARSLWSTPAMTVSDLGHTVCGANSWWETKLMWHLHSVPAQVLTCIKIVMWINIQPQLNSLATAGYNVSELVNYHPTVHCCGNEKKKLYHEYNKWLLTCPTPVHTDVSFGSFHSTSPVSDKDSSQTHCSV